MFFLLMTFQNLHGFFLLKWKSDVLTAFKTFKTSVEKLLYRPIKHFRSDSGGEYMNTSFSIFLSSHGIQHQISCPYTPQQNGNVKRKHRYIIETAISLLQTAHLPLCFWVDAVTMAIFLINRLPTFSSPAHSLFFMLFQTPPDYGFLHVFGCLCYPSFVHMLPINWNLVLLHVYFLGIAHPTTVIAA